MAREDEQGGAAAPAGDDALLQAIMGGTLSPEMLAGGGVTGGNPVEAAALTVEDLITEALNETSAAAILPTSGFTYGEDALPDWFPAPLRDVIETENLPVETLQGIYDPYFGTPEQGDERVYFGDTLNAEVFFGEMTGWGVETYDEADDDIDTSTPRGVAESHRADRANKIEAQLGNDPSQQETEKKKPKKSPNTMTAAQAVNLPYLWDEEQVNNAMKKMREAGLNVTTFDELNDAWGGLVSRSSQMYSLSGGRKKVTPWDVLELSKREAMSAGNFINFESGTQTQTTRSVSEITEGAAWATLQQTLSTLLGRDPTDQELRDYTYRMNTLAAQNPSITETVRRFQAGEIVSTDSNTTGGFDASDLAQEAYEDAQDDPDYGAYQAATTYFNAAQSALGAIGDV